MVKKIENWKKAKWVQIHLGGMLNLQLKISVILFQL